MDKEDQTHAKKAQTAYKAVLWDDREEVYRSLSYYFRDPCPWARTYLLKQTTRAVNGSLLLAFSTLEDAITFARRNAVEVYAGYYFVLRGTLYCTELVPTLLYHWDSLALLEQFWTEDRFNSKLKPGHVNYYIDSPKNTIGGPTFRSHGVAATPKEIYP